MRDATDKLLRQMRQKPIMPMGAPFPEGMIVPNHSGDHKAGIVTQAPTDGLDIVNKDYTDTVMPIGSIIFANINPAQLEMYFNADGSGIATGLWRRYHTCNGNGGTPNLASQFLRMNPAGATVTGGSDTISGHSHSVDPSSFTSGSTAVSVAQLPSHTHTVPGPTIVYGGAAANPGTYLNGGPTLPPPVFYTNGGTGYTNPSCATGATGSGDGHTHAIDVPSTTSSTSSSTDNRPAYYELLPVMRIS